MKPLSLPFLAELTVLRRDMHAHPELAFAEKRTADIVARELQAYGLEVHRGLAKTGVVGVLRAGSGKRMVGLRADMDALPLDEQNDFAHRSTHAGCMHACGHDGHTAMLLGAARYLAEHPDFDGRVAFIFQPAEEAEGGAAVMIEEGLFERFPVESVYGLHNWPGLPVGTMAIHAGAVMASTCRLEMTVSAQGSHAAMPQQGVDAIVTACHLVTALQTVAARNLSPLDAAVVSVTQFHAGSAWNILPDEVTLRGTIRTFKPEIQAAVEAAVSRLCQGMAASFGARIEVSFNRLYPPTINTAAEAATCRRVAEKALGHKNVLTDIAPAMTAEDFSFMLQKKPGCYVWLGNGSGEAGCTLHNPNYDFNDEVLSVGIAYWVELVREILHP
ncbi:hydrolase [Betaproteobacteria bacterium]|nr:hydrolase [Betaproteobacteria bacterium]GHU42742.1 hydrolase [Betaproteobacteria bacterium]